jgi:ubiquinol-cytochrome c reductase cytochrome c1 subunit
MPHVLWELQGTQAAVYEGVTNADGNVVKQFKGFEEVSKGAMSPEEFDLFLRDTVNFLDYIGEPMQLQRKSMGISVIAFLLLLWGFAYALNKEFWKDVK